MKRPDGYWCDFCGAFISREYRYMDPVRLGPWDLCRVCFDRHHAKEMRLSKEAHRQRKGKA